MTIKAIDWVPSHPDTTGWKTRHLDAIRGLGHWRSGTGESLYIRNQEQAIVSMLRGWLDYARAHRARFESGIGEDGVLGPEWAALGAAIRGLLNGETGRLDCGTLDTILCDTLTAEGFNPDQL
jgi:hypothetical protein